MKAGHLKKLTLQNKTVHPLKNFAVWKTLHILSTLRFIQCPQYMPENAMLANNAITAKKQHNASSAFGSRML